MQKFIIAALLAATAAAPALAEETYGGPFNGAHVELLGGVDRDQAHGTHDDGALYGIGAGYDLQHGKIVVGFDGEYSDSTQKQGPAGARETAGRDLYLGARVGTVVGGNNLIYAKAGYTNAEYDGTPAGALPTGKLDGYRVGAGVEHEMGRAFVKAEYRYSNYEQDVSRHQLVAGVGLHF